MVPGWPETMAASLPGDNVEKARFSGIGRTDDGEVDTVAKALAAMSILKMALDLLRQRDDLRPDLLFDAAGQVLVGEIDGCLQVSHRPNQAIPPGVVYRAQFPLILSQRLASLSLGFRIHQIG